MTVKTITIKENAYEALKSLKLPRESFSETLLRIAKRKSLRTFFGVLSRNTGDLLEKKIFEMRSVRNKSHRARVKEIIKEFKKT